MDPPLTNSAPSSPLSSLASRSPSPPIDYPSPVSSNTSDTGCSTITADVPQIYQDGAPPAKKRKVTEQKERTTEYLDLRVLDEGTDETRISHQNEQLNRLVENLRGKKKIVVIAGAGISVSAGIPDFRSSTGLFSTLRTQHKLKSSGKHLFDASVYRNDSSTTSFHSMVCELSHLTQNAKPTPFHHMLATLAEEGRLLRLYSQNVDGIDTSLKPLATRVPLNIKGPWPKTVQLHGGLEKMVCSKCGHLSDFDGALFKGPEPPPCEECETTDTVRVAGGLRSHGIGRLRPRMVLYNEFNPDEEAIGAVSHADLRSRPDAVIVVGTSLKVPGIRRLAKEMCSVTRGRRGGFTAWINYDPEPVGVEFKDCWDMVVRGECDEVARNVGLPKWDDKDIGEFRVATSAEKAKDTNGIIPSVVVKVKTLDVVKTDGILTPTASPRHQSPVPDAFTNMKHPTLSNTPTKTSKLKQRTLSGLPAKDPKPKAKKKPGRRPLNTANTVTKAFKSSKPTKHTTGKVGRPMKLKKDSNPDQLPQLFPGLSKGSSSPMRPVSPFDHRNNNDVTPLVKDESPSSVYYSSVETPSPTRPALTYDRQATISPKTVPSGMAHLLS
ncbi:hypothetical protein B7494_g3203 [Chlorociboria aeruginascens]|nr:hypothetical protein B7494_g3203 [Chlorociboria aeruginascens]